MTPVLPSWLQTFSFWTLLLLATLLPFDLANRPLSLSGDIAVTDLTAVVSAVSLLALISLVRVGLATGKLVSTVPVWDTPRFWLGIALFAALLSLSIASCVANQRPTGGVIWVAALIAGGLLWLAVPCWLTGPHGPRVATLGAALVAGACVAASVGFAEFILGPGFERRLIWFRPGPTTMGPYLRLTGTFHHANDAAMYFCLVLPFALAGLVAAFRSRRWLVACLWLVAGGVVFMGLLLTFSRGGLVASGVSLVVMAASCRRLWLRLPQLAARPLLIPAIAIPGLVALFLASTSSIDVLRATTLSDAGWYQVTYTGRLPATMTAGGQQSVLVTIENHGPLTWRPAAQNDLGLSYHWLDRSERIAQWETTFTWLRSALPSHGQRRLPIMVRAPSAPGAYLLVWDLLWRRTTWFDAKTDTYRVHPVRVVAGKTAGGSAQRLAPPPNLSDPVFLPLAQTTSRTAIWKVAVTMIRRHPWLGSGPHGLRRNYFEIASRPRHGQMSPPSNAHNLLLELAVDWGIPGAAAFVGLIGVLWWPLIQAALAGRLVSPWPIAVIGSGAAFWAHGTVEYFLSTPAILFAFWILCSLAVTGTSRDLRYQ